MAEQLLNQVKEGGSIPTSPLQFTVRQIPAWHTYEWLLKKHYAHRVPSISYAFGLYNGDYLLGVCTYGMCPGREVSNVCGDAFSDKVIELNRVVKQDGLVPNTQSYFLAQTFRLLPHPIIIVSYADKAWNHHGYVYQALNFIYTGMSRSGRTYIFNNQEYHERHINYNEFFKPLAVPYDSTKSIMDNFRKAGGIVDIDVPKYRYVLFLGSKLQRKAMYAALKWERLPYPKGDNQRYDASYEPTRQGVLI